MPSELATRGNIEHYYHQVGLCFARALWRGVVDGYIHRPSSHCFLVIHKKYDFKPIPNFNPYLNHSEMSGKTFFLTLSQT